jgi:hypothetical protein
MTFLRRKEQLNVPPRGVNPHTGIFAQGWLEEVDT